jgi:cell division protein ZapA
MAQVTLDIAGRVYEMTVRAGQEEHFRRLGAIVDAKVRAVSGAMGSINESRQLLMAALLLADEMESAPPPAPAGRDPAPPPPEPSGSIDAAVATQIDKLAQRLETLALKLEKSAPDA